MNKSDELFEALEKAFRRGANWVVINGGFEGLNKAAYDFADYETSPLTAAERASLTAALAVAPGVKVKSLEWEYKERSVGTYIAKDDRGDMYWINQSFGSDSYYFTTIRRADEETLYDADDLDAAKAAAQADYTARIMSALDAPQVKENPQQARYKLAAIQATEHDHPATRPRPTFPILNGNGACVDYQLVADHGGQAQKNHNQSVERLAQRGGLSWCELHAVLHDRAYQKMDQNTAIIECRALEARYLADIATTETNGHE